uniref:RNA-dependent RNA polymerase n=1 Tax=Guangdong chinese water skink picobirnavirus TaxID=2116426 RepID=A0A2P1GN61_9VIRU|nr:RNA-dependent RNA polymerase [Guangdong chinese water skink picobirnavirus]
MSKGKEVNFGNYFNLPNPGLKSYFGIVRQGNDEEYRTTFYKGKSPSEVVSGWRPHLEELSSKWPTLLEFEDDLAGKVGPLSVMKPLKDRLSDIDAYYEGILLPSEPISSKSIADVCKEFRDVAGMHIRDEKFTVQNMKKSTNSGSPYFTKRRNVTSKTLPCRVFIDKDQRNVEQMLRLHDIWQACAVLGWRGQEGGPNKDDVKQRVVWMFPYSVNIKELQVYQPLIELAQRSNLVPAWVSMDAVDANITKLFDSKGGNDLVICTDFSKFDQHFGKDCQDAARSILEHLITGPGSEDWLRSVFPVKYMIPLAYDFGSLRFGKHGMASGSGGTNVDETLTHRALQYEVANNKNAKLNPYSMCLGDDGVLTYPGIEVDDVVRSYTAHGLEMNETKQYVSKQDCIYLRRWHHTDYRINDICVGVYATTRALGRLCEQERYYDPEDWGPIMVALRQLSIIENVKWHPLRDQFADYCMAGDKYRLGIDIPGFLDKINQYAEEAIDLMPDFLGYTKSLQKNDDSPSGIQDWWIVKYLKSKA